ncbi:phosphoglycolate phosphatase [Desulfonatronum zhilinae]|nr:phosphoglycolate phosphatase [Desulfonatronum zhilinae]
MPSMPARQIHGVLFDKDGTLFDFHRTWHSVITKAAAMASGGSENLARVMMEAGGYDATTCRFQADSVIAAGHVGELAELWRDLGAVLPRSDLQRALDAIFAEEALAGAVPVTDLSILFTHLTRLNLRLGIATNDSEASASATVERYALKEFVSFVAGYDSGYGAKPGPGMALAFCESVGLSPRHVAVVGDSGHDMIMGRSAEVRLCVGVLTGAGTMASLASQADIVLPDISGLLELLGRQPGNIR